MKEVGTQGSKGKKVVLVLSLILLMAIAAGAVYAFSLWNKAAGPEGMALFDRKDEEKPQSKQMGEAIEGKSPPPADEGEGTVLAASSENSEEDGVEAISYKGKIYTLRQDLVTVLFMGIDAHGEEEYQQIGLNSNQADSLILAVIGDGDLRMINIPRNTMTEVLQLDANMQPARRTISPICIQHAFGDGQALSAELTRDAAANLLYGVPIHRYIAMNLDGLFAANDALSGVTVELLDDMTAFNPKMEKGAQYTLLGEDAEIYVARRIGEGLDGTNMARIRRQTQYYQAFFYKAKEVVKENPLFAVELYSKMRKDLCTDLKMEEILYLSRSVTGLELREENIRTLPGIVREENFFVDEDALQDMLIELFYTEISR